MNYLVKLQSAQTCSFNLYSNGANTILAKPASAPTSSRRRKPTKLVRGNDSFRPGNLHSSSLIPKALHFYVPIIGGINTQFEMAPFLTFAIQLSEKAGVSINAITIRDGTVEIILNLPSRPENEIDDDHLLSNTFRLINDVIVSSEILMAGSSHPSIRARWSFTIGDFTADQGWL